MSGPAKSLIHAYAAALRDYLADCGEDALGRAYETGRRALAEGFGVLDMVSAHQACMLAALREGPHSTNRPTTDANIERILKQASSCFAECLSPFEMMLRGVQDANVRLQESLESLEAVEAQLRDQNRELLTAHRAVEKERGRYQTLFELAPDGYLVTGLEGAIREANAGAATLLNTPQRHLPGQSLVEFVDHPDREAFRQELHALHLGTMDRVEDWDLSIRPRNKPVIPVVLTVLAERTAPAFSSLRWLIRDATERKRVEKERARWLIARTRARAARRFEFLANASSLLVSSLDVEASLRSVAGLTAAFLSSWCFVAVFDSDDSLRQVEVGRPETPGADVQAALRRHCLFSGGATERLDLLNGPQKIDPLTSEWLEGVADSPEHAALLRELCGSCAMVLPFRIRGRILGVLTVIAAEGARRYRSADLVLCEDLARSCALALENGRLYREVVAERDKAERASRAKGEFVAILGHELRNPLTPVVGWARILKDHPTILQDPVLSEAVQSIERNAAMLTRLVGDCADLTKIAEGKIPVDRIPVDLNCIVATSVEAIRPTAIERGIELAEELASGAASVLGDAVRLKQVVMNLLINAVKYTEYGGHVSVRSVLVEEGAEIEVQDTGIGIDPRFLEQIFEPFRQGTSAWLTSQSGLGLGLAIARRIVEIHGGRIWAESAGLGKGSTFRVRFPAIETPAEQIRFAAAAPAFDDAPAQRILLVEDSPDVLSLMQLELEGMGHTVTTAANGRSGIEIARTSALDLIISDIKMPLVDGNELIRTVRATPGLKAIPAIALTGFGAQMEIEGALAAGFDVCLSKPAEPRQIAALIRTLVERKQVPDSTPVPAKNAAKSAPKETTA